MNIQDFYKYSWFSTLAYVDWRDESINAANPVFAIEDAANAKRVPGSVDTSTVDTLGEKIFSPITDGGEGWAVTDFHPNDSTGFAASLFAKEGTNEKVLAIRGTEPITFPPTDLIADLHEIGEYGMAISQAVSMFNYIQCLKADKGMMAVPQLVLHIDLYPPSSGEFITASLLPPKFISVSVAYNGEGLGLIKPEDNLVVTGHSLGGHLAAAAYRMFPQLIDTAVTYNAPGFDPTVGMGGWFEQFVTTGDKFTDEFFTKLFAPNANSGTTYNLSYTNAVNTEAAQSGGDILYGQGGSDWMYGGQGNDYLNISYADKQAVANDSVYQEVA